MSTTDLTLHTDARLERDVIDGWATQVAAVAHFADYIAQTDFVPEAYRGQPAAVAAAILTGRELGLGPMASLQHVHVIKGRPALSSQAMRALVLAAGHTLRIHESTMARCVLIGARRGGPEQAVTWTMDDAKRANLSGRAMWATYPRQMLLARATAELCRAMFPDVIGGMAVSIEEANDAEPRELDGTPPAVPAVEAPKTTVRRTRKAAAPKNVPGSAPTPPDGPGQDDPRAAAPRDTPPPPPDVQTEAPPPGEGGEGDDNPMMSPQQRAALHAALQSWGRAEPRSLKLRTVSGLIGREVISTMSLTRDEASALLDTLANLKGMPNPDEAMSTLVMAGWDHIDGTRPMLPLEDQ